MSVKKLEKLIQEKDGYITTQDAQKYGIHREYLSMFVKEDKLIRISNGVYQTPNVWQDFLYSFQQKKNRTVYSHGTALYLHQLTDRDPLQYHITVPSGYNTTQLKSEHVLTFTIKLELLDLGKTVLKTPYGNEIIAYNMERTICDLIRSRNKLDVTLVHEGLKNYINSPKRDLKRLMEYAKKLHVEKKMIEYVGLLL